MPFDVVGTGQVAPGLPRFHARPMPWAKWSRKYIIFKTIVDYTFAVLALPFIAVLTAVLFVVNPVLNPGPVFFKQGRMGMGGQRFTMWKFRTMLPSDVQRSHDAPVEDDRITPLGRIMRKTRIDELPNFFNVLRGEMSLVGPRPDAWEHATKYMPLVPNYRERFRVRPGITGLAQVRTGYADTLEAVNLKAEMDKFYVHHSCGKLDVWILYRTFAVMASGFGAK